MSFTSRLIMPSLYQLKPRFQQCLRPAIWRLHRSGISANAMTSATMLASIAFGVWQSVGDKLAFACLPAFLLLRMACNAIDGMLARECDQQTDLGAILNETGDVVSDIALYAPFALLPDVAPGLMALVLLLAILTEMVGILGLVIGASRRYDGPLGKSDRALVFGALAIPVACDWPLAAWFNPLLVILALLLCATIVRRVQRALQQAAKPTAATIHTPGE